MKAILEFNMPEESEEHRTALKGVNYQNAIHRIGQEVFRPHRKHGYGDPLLDSKEAAEIIAKLEEKFYNILNEEDANE